MQYLLDTHILLWFLEDNDKLSETSKKIILDVEKKCAISIISLWEISIKKNIGKLQLDFTISNLEKEIEKQKIEILPISITSLQIYETLPIYAQHKDPFDRYIISTALAYDYTIISADASFEIYNDLIALQK